MCVNQESEAYITSLKIREHTVKPAHKLKNPLFFYVRLFLYLELVRNVLVLYIFNKTVININYSLGKLSNNVMIIFDHACTRTLYLLKYILLNSCMDNIGGPHKMTEKDIAQIHTKFCRELLNV
jgi:hypothetical protein